MLETATPTGVTIWREDTTLDTITRTAEPVPAIPAEGLAELEAVIADLIRGIRDPEKIRRACEDMDRTREEIRRRIGVIDFAVPTIRALRDGDEEE